jgi:hypothetical protein
MDALTLRFALASLVLFSASAASAQIDPEGGDVFDPQQEQPPPDEVQQTEPQDRPWYQGGPTGREEPAPAEAPPQTEQTAPTPTGSDHSRVVGHAAFGYMGITSVPIGGLGSPVANESVPAPALGLRFWLTELIGIDGGIGFGFSGGSLDTGPTSVPVNSAYAITIHVGVPLALFHSEHYVLLVAPEANLGFAFGTLFDPVDSDFDRSRSGLVFQLGGRVGGEIHFGFMNIPQLSLQAGIGLYFQYASAGVGAARAGDPVDDPVNSEVTSLATTVQGEPWQILVGSLNALYYF